MQTKKPSLTLQEVNEKPLKLKKSIITFSTRPGAAEANDDKRPKVIYSNITNSAGESELEEPREEKKEEIERFVNFIYPCPYTICDCCLASRRSAFCCGPKCGGPCVPLCSGCGVCGPCCPSSGRDSSGGFNLNPCCPCGCGCCGCGCGCGCECCCKEEEKKEEEEVVKKPSKIVGSVASKKSSLKASTSCACCGCCCKEEQKKSETVEAEKEPSKIISKKASAKISSKSCNEEEKNECCGCCGCCNCGCCGCGGCAPCCFGPCIGSCGCFGKCCPVCFSPQCGKACQCCGLCCNPCCCCKPCSSEDDKNDVKKSKCDQNVCECPKGMCPTCPECPCGVFCVAADPPCMPMKITIKPASCKK